MDEGRLYYQKEFDIEEEMNVKDCMDIINNSFISNLKNLIDDLKNDVKPFEQIKTGVTYSCLRLPVDGLINWNLNNTQIHNFIRSQSYPYPGAYSFLDGNKIIFQKSRVLDEICHGSSGQIFKITNEGLFIVCSNNSLLLIEKIIVNDIVVNPHKYIKSIKLRFSNFNIDELKNN